MKRPKKYEPLILNKIDFAQIKKKILHTLSVFIGNGSWKKTWWTSFSSAASLQECQRPLRCQQLERYMLPMLWCCGTDLVMVESPSLTTSWKRRRPQPRGGPEPPESRCTQPLSTESRTWWKAASTSSGWWLRMSWELEIPVYPPNPSSPKTPLVSCKRFKYLYLQDYILYSNLF